MTGSKFWSCGAGPALENEIIKTLLPAILSATLLAMPAADEDLSFLLVNESSADLVEFNVSEGSSSSWEEKRVAFWPRDTRSTS